MANIDHTNCTHPRTPAGRRACRAGRVIDPIVAIEERMERNTGTDWVAGLREIAGRKNAPTAQDMTKIRTRLDHLAGSEGGPLRHAEAMRRITLEANKKRRIKKQFASCVQAALHIDAHGGRCACGWIANAG